MVAGLTNWNSTELPVVKPEPLWVAGLTNWNTIELLVVKPILFRFDDWQTNFIPVQMDIVDDNYHETQLCEFNPQVRNLVVVLFSKLPGNPADFLQSNWLGW